MANSKTFFQRIFHPTIAVKYGDRAYGVIGRCIHGQEFTNEYDYFRKLLRGKK